jgi:hypothetical protein
MGSADFDPTKYSIAAKRVVKAGLGNDEAEKSRAIDALIDLGDAEEKSIKEIRQSIKTKKLLPKMKAYEEGKEDAAMDELTRLIGPTAAAEVQMHDTFIDLAADDIR